MAENTGWQLEDFVDSLVVDLDRTRETLAVRAINRPLTYTVKEVALDLNIFPSYDGDQVTFVTAQPGQQGASKVSIQLNSITDQQVRATTKMPAAPDDVGLRHIDVDKTTRKTLRKLGVNSVDDLAQIERRKIDLEAASDGEIDYTKLANQIRKSRRNQNPPRIDGVSLSTDATDPVLVVRGANLAVDPAFPPVAVVNDRLAEVLSSSADEVRVGVGRAHRLSACNELVLTFDPFAIARVNVRA
ncbi:hypothetical protein [Couchioplanes azureus]|uniref:hypothetical protein n=1 Tax=Couchioplanes caeruleus TaxID=56438 RepID=UPI0016716602|nr:hypothetical protein [Couchioplanes caeruleus]GGQ70081.1 hypothetical protein GCM10010166_44900 [Couchioplanes caeruleus subsp. azureus]